MNKYFFRRLILLLIILAAVAGGLWFKYGDTVKSYVQKVASGMPFKTNNVPAINIVNNVTSTESDSSTPEEFIPTPSKEVALPSVPNNFPIVTITPELNLVGYAPKIFEKSVGLSAVPNYKAIKERYSLKLSANEEKYLEKNKFLLLPLERSETLKNIPGFDYMISAFDAVQGADSEYFRAPENVKLVTPDLVLHAYHRFFEMTLEELEKGDLAVTLNNFLISLYDNLLVAANKSTPELKPNYQRLLAQLTVARVLLDNHTSSDANTYFSSPEEEQAYLDKDKTIDGIDTAKKMLAKYKRNLSPEMTAAVEKELELIYASSGIATSPLFGLYKEGVSADYTQYTPRSHYTKNSSLRAYFRAMMYLGRNSYFFTKDDGWKDANLLTEQFLVKSKLGTTPFTYWKKVMDVTGLYAGQSDDLTYSEWMNFISSTFNGATISGPELASNSIIKKMKDNAGALRLPRILSDVVYDENMASKTKEDLLAGSLSYRIFGQRFTFDAWMLNSLTAGDEKTELKLPSTPTALYVPAIFGDDRAKEQLQTWLTKENNYASSDVKTFMMAIKNKGAEIANIKSNEWFASMGSAWLYILSALTNSYGPGYPLYMQAGTFADKQIESFLGSYTELKHDTLLYAKQSYAERGGGGDVSEKPPVPKGFVEPNVLFWRKFTLLVDFTEKIFKEYHLSDNSESLNRLSTFNGQVKFLSGLAEKELKGEKISDDEYEQLRKTNFSYLVLPLSQSERGITETSGRTALIADIHTDAIKNQILYEAVGNPYLMLAIVGNENSPRLVLGTAYNHYEFTDPIGKRLADEDWRAKVYENSAPLPSKNFWYQMLIIK